MAPRLFVYRQIHDTGIAPHISNAGILTLSLCKPQIRLQAHDGDYVMALVGMSANPLVVGKGPDRYFKVSYIFRVSEKVHMREYRRWCLEHAPNKIPNEETFMGNCQYNSNLEWMPGPHGPEHARRNTSGCYSVISHEFGGWTFEHPYTLTDTDMATLGLPMEKIQKRGVGHAVYPLSEEQEGYLHHLMAAAPIQPGIPSITENMEAPIVCRTKGSCSRKRTRKQRRGRKATRRQGYS